MARERRSSQDIADAALSAIYNKYQIPAERKGVKIEGQKTSAEILSKAVSQALLYSDIGIGASTN